MYTTQAKIEALAGVTLSSAQVAALSDVISAVTSFIDNYVGKSFEASMQTRYYDGNGRENLLIDSFVTAGMGVEVLNVNGSTQKTLTRGHSNDFITSPYNQTEKNELIFTRNGSFGAWSKGRHRIRVSAKFGASTSVPADISMAATKLAYQLLRTDTPDGTQLTSIRLGDYAATYAVLTEQTNFLGVKSILDAYRDIEI